jgi:hypothetical protein
MNLYEDVLILSVIYAFIIGLIAREGHIDPVLWCSDRDARTSWGARIFSFYALLNAYDWARQYGQRLDAAQLPSVIFCAQGEDVLDPLIRPADYLAGSIATGDLTRETGTQRAKKYGQMLRDAVAENPNVVILHLRRRSSAL